MKFIKFFTVGIVFGIVLTKSQVISWYRIFEMFHFDSFHMYGIIGSAIVLGIIGLWLMKKLQLKTSDGSFISIPPKEKKVKKYLFGGIIFGLGWVMTGACPGPLFALVGAGYLSYIVVIISAILGTFVYGLLRDRLPH